MTQTCFNSRPYPAGLARTVLTEQIRTGRIFVGPSDLGPIPPAQRIALDGHASECPRCRRFTRRGGSCPGVRIERPAGLATCWRDEIDVLVTFPAFDGEQAAGSRQQEEAA